MKRTVRVFSILFAMALVLVFSLVATTPVAAQTTYYVATTGSDLTGDGSVGNPWQTIQYAVSQVGVGDTIMVAAGTYLEPSETTITQDVTVIGADKTTTIIKKAGGFSGSYFFRVNGGRLSLSNVTLDGEGNLYGGVRLGSPGTGTISNNIFQNIVDGTYLGFGVVVYASNAIISNNIFTNIGRVGVWVGQGNNNLVTGNTYTGKGAGDCLDYGIEVGMGGVATITGNTITNCLGVASSDGSTSAAILVTTYYGAGTTATITGNTLTGNTGGIAVGYDASDTSTVVAHNNNIYGNTDFGIDTTAPTVDATNNWWGSSSGPGGVGPGTGDGVSAGVNYDPWLDDPYGTVGWETYPISKTRVLLPWIALFAAMLVGASFLVLKRRQAQS